MKNNEEIRKTLQSCPEFQGFSVDELTVIAGFANTKEYHKSQEVFSFDHQGNYFYVVAEGRFSLHLRNNISREYGPGEVFGELAIFNERNRTGAIKAQTQGRLVSIKNDMLLKEDALPAELKSKLLFRLARKMVEYLQNNYESNSAELIQGGESATVEFKESVSKSNCEKVTQTLCAFMNSNGGTIFLGVHDSGEILGLEGENIDKFRLCLNDRIHKHLGSAFYHLVHFDVENIKGKRVLRIDCRPSDRPVFFKDEEIQKGKPVLKELFFVRHDSANRNFKNTNEAIRFVERRFAA
jgi:CRP-like cAMP-binding protein